MLSSTIITISSTNILIIWLCLELNLFSFIPLLLKDSLNNEIEASLFYFLAQTLGSTLFLLRNTILLVTCILNRYYKIALIMSIIIKLGAAPCHHWYPMTIKIIRWVNCFILSGWQKLAPIFTIIYWIIPNTKKIVTLILLISSINAITGGIMGLNQVSLKKIIAYSSITHIGWILRRSTTNSPHLSIIYLSIYILIIMPLFISFKNMNSNKVHDLWYKQNTPKHITILTSIILISLAGLPPITGFIPKLLILSTLVNYSSALMVLLIAGSLINLFFYLNIRLNILTNNQQELTNNNKKISIIPINTAIALNLLRVLFVVL